ncbi:MAG: hypothetical protein IBJ19_13805, partial [Gemmatimonadaceae bacterium]|nr:hypothetical protein [Gemmatimonadaceae bacterium]
MTAPALRSAPASERSLDARLTSEQGGLQARVHAGSVLLVLAVLTVAIAVGALLLADGRWMRAPRPLPFVMWALGLGGAWGAVRWWRARHAALLSRAGLAGAIETEQSLRAGALRGALEVAEQGVLGARAAADVARQLSVGPLVPQATRRVLRGVTLAGCAAALGVAAVATAARTVPDGLSVMRRPLAAWRGTLLPAMTFDRLPTRVPRGMPVTVRVLAPSRETVRIAWRAEGEAWRDTTLQVTEDGRVQLPLGPVRAPTAVRVNDGRAPELQAALVIEDRGWIGDVSLRALYPAYLGRSDESLEPVPPLRVPRGTRVRVRVMLHAGARDARLVNGTDTVAMQLAGDAVGTGQPAEALLPIDRDGTWQWLAEATPRADGAVLAPELPDALPFTVIPDQKPAVEIVAPMTDTAIGPTGQVAVLVDASDDHGVARVHLVVWRERSGAAAPVAGPVQRERIDVAAPGSPVFEGGATLTLDGRQLEPGDKLHVTAVATDDSPWAQESVSAEIILRMPTLAEQRSMARALADSLAQRAAQLAQQERRLQQNTSDASRSRELQGSAAEQNPSAGAKSEGNKSQSMSFSAAEKAKQMAREQQQLGARVDSLRQSAQELESRLRNANALDTTLASRMRDIQKMLRDAMTPEMQKQLEELNRNADRLSGTQAQQSMQQLAEQQKQMREQLERSAEMLKRAALEGAMQTLRDDARDLSKEQRQMADRMEGAQRRDANGKPGEAKDGAEQRSSSDPRSLAERSRDIEREVQNLAKRLEEAGARSGAEKTREAQPLAKQAADAMSQAAREAARQQQAQQQQQGQQQQGQQGQQGQQQQGQQGQQQQGQQGQQGQQQQGQQGQQGQ